MKYVPPAIDRTAFNCPHCDVLAKQYWGNTGWAQLPQDKTPEFISDVTKLPFDQGSRNPMNVIGNINISRCSDCYQFAIWLQRSLIFPRKGGAPLPNPDLSEDIKADYLEAASIFDLSPRGAAALLRLAIQKLCVELGQPGKNINKDIGALVKNGLNIHVQKSLDSVRVIGNEAVHPGVIDLQDNKDIAFVLFKLLNFIVEKMITEPKHIDEIYGNLPESKKAQIEKRDAKED